MRTSLRKRPIAPTISEHSCSSERRYVSQWPYELGRYASNLSRGWTIIQHADDFGALIGREFWAMTTFSPALLAT